MEGEKLQKIEYLVNKKSFLVEIKNIMHIGVSPPSFFPNPPLNLPTVQAPLFRQFPLLYWFFVTPPPPSELLKYQSFSSLTPSCLLKVTMVLVKIYQFEF